MTHEGNEMDEMESDTKRECPDHHKDYCSCRKWHEQEVKERRSDSAFNAYESLGFELQDIGNYQYAVVNHPELIVSCYGKWKLNGKWNKGVGALKDYIRSKQGKKPLAKKKRPKILSIANSFKSFDIRKGVPNGFAHFAEHGADNRCVRNGIEFCNALVGFEKSDGRWQPVILGVIVRNDDIQTLEADSNMSTQATRRKNVSQKSK